MMTAVDGQPRVIADTPQLAGFVQYLDAPVLLVIRLQDYKDRLQ